MYYQAKWKLCRHDRIDLPRVTAQPIAPGPTQISYLNGQFAASALGRKTDRDSYSCVIIFPLQRGQSQVLPLPVTLWTRLIWIRAKAAIANILAFVAGNRANQSRGRCFLPVHFNGIRTAQ